MNEKYFGDSKEWDVFISHASEDKKDVARPIAEKLQEHGLTVWYDEFTLRVGDSLSDSINLGLAKSIYGVVILSPNFINKKWPRNELNGLVAREELTNQIILPVWHNINEKEVKTFSPILADRIALRSSEGIEKVIQKLIDRIGSQYFGRRVLGIWKGSTGRLHLTASPSGEITGDYDWNHHRWSGHLKGKIEKNVLRFEWYWDMSVERGNGLFIIDNSDEKATLKGGWTFDYDKVSLHDVAKTIEHSKFHQWAFRFSHTPYNLSPKHLDDMDPNYAR